MLYNSRSLKHKKATWKGGFELERVKGLAPNRPNALFYLVFKLFASIFQANASQFASHFSRFNHNNAVFLIVNAFFCQFKVVISLS